MEFLVACSGYDWRDLVDQDGWRALLGNNSPRAYDAIEEKSSAIDNINTHDSLYDVVYESERSKLEVSAKKDQR